jgi:hypothetical protein
MFIFAPRSLYLRNPPATYWTGGCEGLRVNLDALEKIKNPGTLPGIEPQLLGCPAQGLVPILTTKYRPLILRQELKYHHHVVCHVTVPYYLPERAPITVRYSASSFNFQYLFLSLTFRHHATYTDMRRLTMGIRSEKCVVRRFRRCTNVTECTSTNLDTIAYYTPRLYSISLLPLRYKPVQHVNVLNTVGNCNTMVLHNIVILRHIFYFVLLNPQHAPLQ